jgi:type IV pilus assembly protein PilE
MTPPTNSRTSRGFTLIELMIVVAIVAILAAVAYPTYRDSVERARRADAKSVLMEAAQWIERQYTLSNAYNKLGDGSVLNTAALPAQLREAPKDGASKYYDIQFAANPTTTAYTLQAVPKNSMTGDKCGTLTLTEAGTKSATGTAGADWCWSK